MNNTSFRFYIIKISIVLSFLYIISVSQVFNLHYILFSIVTLLCIIPRKIFIILGLLIATIYSLTNPSQMMLMLIALLLGVSLGYIKIPILSLIFFNIAYLLVIDYSTFNTLKWGFEHMKLCSQLDMGTVSIIVLVAALYSIYFIMIFTKHAYWISKYMKYLALSLLVLIGISLLSWLVPWGSAIILFGLIAMLCIEAIDRITKE